MITTCNCSQVFGYYDEVLLTSCKKYNYDDQMVQRLLTLPPQVHAVQTEILELIEDVRKLELYYLIHLSL